MKFMTLLVLFFLSSSPMAGTARIMEENNGGGSEGTGTDQLYNHDFTASFTQQKEDKKYLGKIGDVTPQPAWFTYMTLTFGKTIKLSFILSDDFDSTKLDVDSVTVNDVFLSDGEYVGVRVPRLRYIIDELEADDLLEDSVIVPERDSLSLKFTEVRINNHYQGTDIVNKPTWLKSVDLLLGGRQKKILFWLNDGIDSTNSGTLGEIGLITVNNVAFGRRARLVRNNRFLVILTDDEADKILENNTITLTRHNFDVDFSINSDQTKYSGNITSSPVPSWIREIDIMSHSQIKLIIWANRDVTLSDLGTMGSDPILVSINNVPIENAAKVITSSNGNVKRLLFIITQDELSNILGE